MEDCENHYDIQTELLCELTVLFLYIFTEQTTQTTAELIPYTAFSNSSDIHSDLKCNNGK